MHFSAPESALASLDYRQLRLLHMLLTQRSVTAVAMALNLSQPAVSLRLARLRDVFGDPLLVRSGAGMIPSDRGRDLLEPLASVLDGFERLTADRPFTPAQSTRTLRVGSPNYLGPFLLPALAAKVLGEAPGMFLSLETMVPGRDHVEALASGALDLLIGNWPDPPDHLHSLPLPEDRLICIVARSHPLAGAGALSLDQYLDADHLSPSPVSERRFSPVDAQLARLRKLRRIRAVLPDYTLIPQIVAGTGLMLTTGARFAGFAQRTADVCVLDAPPEFEPVRFSLLWHERSRRDAAHRWVRTLLRDIVAQLPIDA